MKRPWIAVLAVARRRGARAAGLRRPHGPGREAADEEVRPVLATPHHLALYTWNAGERRARCAAPAPVRRPGRRSS